MGGDGWDSEELYKIASGAHGRLLLLQPLHGREPRPAGPGLRRQVQGRLQARSRTRWRRSATTPRWWPRTPWTGPRTSPARPSPKRWPPPRTSRPSRAPSRSDGQHNAVKSAVVIAVENNVGEVRGHGHAVAAARAGRHPAPPGPPADPQVSPRDRVRPAPGERPLARHHLRPDRAGLHDGLRRPQAHQLRPWRRLHGGRVHGLLRRGLPRREGDPPAPWRGPSS